MYTMLLFKRAKCNVNVLSDEQENKSSIFTLKGENMFIALFHTPLSPLLIFLTTFFFISFRINYGDYIAIYRFQGLM